MNTIHFWNGNKTASRQAFELSLLNLCLKATDTDYAATKLVVDSTDHPAAEDEANVFASGADILVTVAGNTKFSNIPKHVIAHPLMKGLLGYRLLLVRESSLQQFKQIATPDELRQLAIGIPETWADADLFRHNQYKVIERGNLENLLGQLANNAFDYVALGVNEIEDVFQRLAVPLGSIKVEPSLMLFYPFPLVFYVNVNQAELATRIKEGLRIIFDNGVYQALFDEYYNDLIKRLNLRQRKVFTLENHLLPQEMTSFKFNLLD